MRPIRGSLPSIYLASLVWEDYDQTYDIALRLEKSKTWKFKTLDKNQEKWVQRKITYYTSSFTLLKNTEKNDTSSDFCISNSISLEENVMVSLKEEKKVLLT